MRLKVIIPNAGMDRATLSQREVMLSAVARPDTRISVDGIDRGPVSIESAYDELLAAPEIVQRVVGAEQEGYDAAVVYCLSDPAVSACRELVDIPVVGPGQASMLLACALGYRFSVLTVLGETVPQVEEQVRRTGVDPSRLASVRSVDIPVVDVREDIPATVRRLSEVGARCLEEDGAHVLVLGCLGFAGMAPPVSANLGVPVVDPAFAAVNLAELLHAQGLTQSRRAYPAPPEKLRR